MTLLSQSRITPDAIKTRAMQHEPAVLCVLFNKDFAIVKTREGFDVMDKHGNGLAIQECFSWSSSLDESINYSHFELHAGQALCGRRVKLQTLSYFVQSFILEDYLDAYPQYQPLLAHAQKQHQKYLDLKDDLRWHRFPHMIHYFEYQIGA